jgi:ADP-ribose pyrophosphatase
VSSDFETLYEHSDGLPVRLEGAPRTGADGSMYRHHRLVVAEGRPGAVILALSAGNMLLVLSNRSAAGATLWELPRGAGEPDETSTETALRELLEETGLRATSATEIGRYVTDSTIFPQRVAVVSCLVDSGDPVGLADGEVLDQRWIPVGEIPELIRNGTLADAHSLAALSLYSAGGFDG